MRGGERKERSRERLSASCALSGDPKVEGPERPGLTRPEQHGPVEPGGLVGSQCPLAQPLCHEPEVPGPARPEPRAHGPARGASAFCAPTPPRPVGLREAPSGQVSPPR